MSTPFAGVICPEHGRVDIDEAEYERQLSKPDSLWLCHCGEAAEFDDERFESLQQVDALSRCREACISMEPVGSRVTCSPAPTDTDEDWLALIDAAKWDALLAQLGEQGWEIAGSRPADECDITAEQTFASFTLGTLNLIVTVSTDFYNRFMAATHVARRLNLLEKADRIALFQAVLYANQWIEPNPEASEDFDITALETA